MVRSGLPPDGRGAAGGLQATPWIHEKAYDPVRAFEGVEAPMLFILGGEDFDVPVKRTLEVIAELHEREARDVRHGDR